MELGAPKQVAIDTRRISESDLRARLPALLNSAFPVPPGASFFDDFPIWDPSLPVKGVEHYGAYSAVAGLVAVAGIRFAELRAPRGMLPIAMIGAVATDPAWQGRGIASRLVSDLVRRSRENGTAAIFLWGSEHDLYRRLGFELAGEQVSLPLSDLGGLDGRAPAALNEGFSPAIFACMRSREGGLALKPEDETWISAHRSVRWFTVGNPRAPRAYAALGRGIDLPGLVHEWGGDRGALLDLLAALRLREPEAALLASPWLLERAGLSHGTAQAQFLCMAQVTDSAALARAYGVDEGRMLPRALWIWGLDAV